MSKAPATRATFKVWIHKLVIAIPHRPQLESLQVALFFPHSVLQRCRLKALAAIVGPGKEAHFQIPLVCDSENPDTSQMLLDIAMISIGLARLYETVFRGTNTSPITAALCCL